MAGSQRQQRVQEALKETLTEALPLLKDPRLGFVTLTGVEVSADLSYARVFFSILGAEEEQEASLRALKRASGFLRREVARRMQLRHTPELDFRLDRTPERAEQMMDLLEKIRLEDAARAAGTGAPSGQDAISEPGQVSGEVSVNAETNIQPGSRTQ